MTSGHDPASTEVTYRLPPTADAPALARRYVEAHGASLDEDMLADARLLVSEIVTNAVLHGQPDITLSLRFDPPGVGVRVHDNGSMIPTDLGPKPNPVDSHGRGLHIVAALAESWGVEQGDDAPGKTVWFSLRP